MTAGSIYRRCVNGAGLKISLHAFTRFCNFSLCKHRDLPGKKVYEIPAFREIAGAPGQGLRPVLQVRSAVLFYFAALSAC